MLLAGGQGTRLGVLTEDMAKPAVPFGGKYRIIDFPISNCINSDIDTVGVLTQYRPFELHQYIGNGQPWDLDRLNGGIFVLPPYMRAKSGEWYKGTANAIYQNIDFIDRYNPDYVVLLSGDHIYKMNYDRMMDAHKSNNADCTIAVLNVSIEEAHRFGIMETDDNNRIVAFEEKPKQPKSTKASMGIYIFTWDKLRSYLIADENNPESENDFGKNVIPAMLADGQRMFAYEFDGYWKDVGTISSLWEANMDLLDSASGLDIDDPNWKIYARNSAEPPQYLAADATVKNSIISEGCLIEGEIGHSVISHGCTVGKGAVVFDSILMPGATVKAGATVRHAIVGWDATVGVGATVGSEQKAPVVGEWKIAVVAPNLSIADGRVVGEGQMVRE